MAAMSETILPSGAQVTIEYENQRAGIVEVGGGLRTYTAGDWQVLDGYEASEMASGGRGQPLMPWPNRLRDGRYNFEGSAHTLALSEPATSNAIHGLVRWANWTVAERAPERVRMQHTLHAQSGYPFVLALTIEYALGPGGLTVTMSAVNRGDHACPFGAGAHPYVSAGTERVDDCRLRIPATRRLITDERSLPIGAEAVTGTPFDFTRERMLGAARLDTGYGDLVRDDDGLARTVLSDPASGRSVTVWQDEHFPFAMVFTGDTLPARRRGGVAVEPMTCPPDAFNSGEGLIRLAPGEAFTGSWGITPRTGAAGGNR